MPAETASVWTALPGEGSVGRSRLVGFPPIALLPFRTQLYQSDEVIELRLEQKHLS